MIRSKFKNQTEIFMIAAFQLFLLGGAIVKLFSTNARLSYLLVTSFALLVIIITFMLVNNLFKSVQIAEDWITVKRLFQAKTTIRKDEIEGYWTYKTIGALGQEESIYIMLKNGKKIGFHAKAYKNFHKIKNGFKGYRLNNLGDYDYEKTYLKYLKVAIPLTFLISVILFLLSKVL